MTPCELRPIASLYVDRVARITGTPLKPAHAELIYAVYTLLRSMDHRHHKTYFIRSRCAP